MTNRSILKILILLICGWIKLGYCQDIGSKCTLSNTQPGECRRIESCISVYNDREKHKKPPKLCGFEGSKPIVCCPDSDISPVVNKVAEVQATSTLKPIPSRNEFNDNKRDHCERFSAFVYENISIPGEVNVIRENRCSLKKNEKVVTRKQTESKEFPHMVLIGSDSNKEVRYFCAGALISEQYVLTSAHCILNTGAKYVKVTGTSKGEYFTIIHTIPHPQYTNQSFYHDIGLVKLNRPVTLTPYTRPACLPYTTNKVNISEPLSNFIYSTWEIGSDTNIKFIKVNLSKMEKKECDTYYNDIQQLSNGIDAVTQICTINRSDSNVTECQVNLGGPIKIYHPKNYCSYLVLGISSFSKSCGFAESPLVFTDVRSYITWIEQTVFLQ
uniref:CSON010664 protein n=1 Tax=Culicoides sonorensis TaxID=179676 RepID=A0A336M1Z0_CULSO